jgi:hypothetical protein
MVFIRQWTYYGIKTSWKNPGQVVKLHGKCDRKRREVI